MLRQLFTQLCPNSTKLMVEPQQEECQDREVCQDREACLISASSLEDKVDKADNLVDPQLTKLIEKVSICIIVIQISLSVLFQRRG